MTFLINESKPFGKFDIKNHWEMQKDLRMQIFSRFGAFYVGFVAKLLLKQLEKMCLFSKKSKK